MQHLSDVFKFTQGLGQKGHQIGRKVGDAIELLTLGMINLEANLAKYLVIEDGVEGATTAKHKVEFSFYNLNDDLPTKEPADLFGLIECKKVGVEQTVKQNFKTWKSKEENKADFFQTNGYSFTNSPTGTNFKWTIDVSSIEIANDNIKIVTIKKENGTDDIISNYTFQCETKSQILIAVDIQNVLHVLGPYSNLSEIEHSINKCIIIQIEKVTGNRIIKINVNEALTGPQTPEKAKQASFVSLDVRKKVLDRYEKTDDKSFVSILVIGEASHWENKSRSIVRLCNDYNLIIPDEILVYLFSKFEEKFGADYQKIITKTKYHDKVEVKELVDEIIQHFNRQVLIDMDTDNYVKFIYRNVDNSNRLVVELLEL